MAFGRLSSRRDVVGWPHCTGLRSRRGGASRCLLNRSRSPSLGRYRCSRAGWAPRSSPLSPLFAPGSPLPWPSNRTQGRRPRGETLTLWPVRSIHTPTAPKPPTPPPLRCAKKSRNLGRPHELYRSASMGQGWGSPAMVLRCPLRAEPRTEIGAPFTSSPNPPRLPPMPNAHQIDPQRRPVVSQ